MGKNLEKKDLYVCPMHPKEQKDSPGDCSICGMALEQVVPSDKTEKNPELVDFKRRFFIGLILMIPLLFLEMGSHFFDMSLLISNQKNHYLQFIFATPIVIWAGKPFFIKAYKAIINKKLNMFSLISMGTGVTFLYSVMALFFPEIFPKRLKDFQGMVPVYFEAAAVIIELVLLGQILELKAHEKTGGAIKALLNLAPKSAKIITKNGEQDILIEKIKVGDLLRIRPGEKIPVDAVVEEGVTYVDESMITGESVAVCKKVKDEVIGGTINTNGSIIIKATKVGFDTVLAHMIQMVAEAQRSRASIQRLVDVVSSYFVPSVVLAAFVTWIAWMFLSTTQGFSYGLISAVSVLMIACPCALGLATPMSIMVGVGKGAKHGILVKDAQSLESLEKVNLIILDKTGTLTEGKPAFSSVSSFHLEFSESDILQIAASLEKSSEHPLALAITEVAKDKKIKTLDVKGFENIPGKGVSGEIEGKKFFLGNHVLMETFRLSKESLQKLNEKKEAGETVMFLSNTTEALGFITVKDPLKKDAASIIDHLKTMHIQSVMLTGDHHKTAQGVASKVGIDHFKAEVLPQDKAQIVSEYKKEGYIVAMVGDGVNDALALSHADVGIAMGTGTDVAIESAGITLLKGSLLKCVSAISLSRIVMSNIRQNLFLAFIYNILGIPIAAGVLYPFLGILLSPIVAAIAMSLSSISVIGNALRLNLKSID